MYTLSSKARDLVPYEPLKGDFKVRLDANESFLDIKKDLGKEIALAVSEVTLNRYPDPTATELRELIGKKYGVSPELITVGNGSDELISVIFSALAEKGDTVAVCENDFSMYSFYPYLSELNVVKIKRGDDLTLSADEIIEKINASGAKIFIFSNPCNPVSLGISRKDVLKIARSVKALVIADEAYMDFWDQSVMSEAGKLDNLMILKTCSKAFACAALRLGVAIAPKNISLALAGAKSPYNVNSISQAIGKVIFSHPELLDSYAETLIKSRKSLENSLHGLMKTKTQITEIYPSCTNFILMKLDESKQVWEALLQRSIAVRHFDGYLRITAGTPEENDAVILALSEILE